MVGLRQAGRYMARVHVERQASWEEGRVGEVVLVGSGWKVEGRAGEFRSDEWSVVCVGRLGEGEEGGELLEGAVLFQIPGDHLQDRVA